MRARGKALLVTGAGGYLGSGIAMRALAAGETSVILWLHARDAAELEEKSAALRAALGAHAERAIIRGGDLGAEEPFADVDPREVGRIVHAAAVTRFNVEHDLAETVNVAGAEKLYDFATRCPGLERLVLLSSVYAAGLIDGRVHEAPLLEPPDFANHYERSKWRCERRLVDTHGRLPWSIVRVATVIAANEFGEVRQQNAFHNTLKLLFYGLVSLIPGDPRTPVYLVTEKFVLDAVMAVLERGEHARVYHACHLRDESLALGALVDTAYRRFCDDDDFAARRLLAPLFCDRESFALLADGVGSFGGQVVRQGLASIVPFAAQLYSSKNFDNARLVALMDGRPAPDAHALVGAACDYLVRTRWGARIARAA